MERIIAPPASTTCEAAHVVPTPAPPRPLRRFNVIKIDKEILERHGIWIAPSTLKKWRATGQHPQLFLVIGNLLHIDLDAWDRHMMAPAQADRSKRIDGFRSMGLLD
jgi:hypothetical protein